MGFTTEIIGLKSLHHHPQAVQVGIFLEMMDEITMIPWPDIVTKRLG